MHLFLNGIAASAGGGLTYLRNVLPSLSKRSRISATVLVSEELEREFEGLPNIRCIAPTWPADAMRRFWHEQTDLSTLIKNTRADLLISAGNFALRSSPIPQILLSGNSLYTSKHFFSDLRSRGEYRLIAETRIRGLFAKKSISWADCTVAPTAAFAAELRCWTGGEVRCIHHGFDRERFLHGKTTLPAAVQHNLDAGRDSLRLLFVSHYNYYRNFETLFRALQVVKSAQKVKLFLTCNLSSLKNDGDYKTGRAATLLRDLELKDDVVELGIVPYESLHHVYRACDLYVTASYAETFAHPLVEAMASGLPVIASALGVHREVCGDAALYFDSFSSVGLASRISELAQSEDLRQRLRTRGLERSKDFSWDSHLDQLLALADELLTAPRKLGRARGTM